MREAGGGARRAAIGRVVSASADRRGRSARARASLSVAVTRSTKKTPSVNRSIWSAAARRASRVLPVPPGPVSVTSRTSASSSRSRMAVELGVAADECRRLGRQVVRPEVERRRAAGTRPAGPDGPAGTDARAGPGPSAGARRDRGARAVRAGWPSRSSAVASDSRIWPPWPAAMIRAVRLTAGPKKSPPRDSASPVWIPIRTRIAHAVRPRLREEGALRGDRRQPTASTGAAKTAMSPSPVVLTTSPVRVRDRGAEDGVVPRQRGSHRPRVLLPQARAALDVGEEEGPRRRGGGGGRRHVDLRR